MPAYTLIIHDLAQAHFAGDIASRVGVQIEIRSPAGGAANLGPALFQVIAMEIKKRHPGVVQAIILDCGCNPGLALSALRQGCRDICINASGEVRRKLTEIATAMNARLHDQPAASFDLGAFQNDNSDDYSGLNAALRNYFQEDPENG